MAKMHFTAAAVEKMKAPLQGRAEYFDKVLTGFHLRITQKGKKTWGLTYRYANKSRRMMLGTYPVLSLAEAREKAREALQTLENGYDPAALKKQDILERSEYTLSRVIDLFVERYAKPKNRCWKGTEAYLRNTVGKEWGDVPIRDITRKDVHAYFDRLADEGLTYAANNVFRAFRRLCNWAAEREIIDVSPCMYVKLPHKPESRDRIMSDDEVRRYWKACDTLG